MIPPAAVSASHTARPCCDRSLVLRGTPLRSSPSIRFVRTPQEAAPGLSTDRVASGISSWIPENSMPRFHRSLISGLLLTALVLSQGCCTHGRRKGHLRQAQLRTLQLYRQNQELQGQAEMAGHLAQEKRPAAAVTGCGAAEPGHRQSATGQSELGAVPAAGQVLQHAGGPQESIGRQRQSAI